jgi:hypothetical protein
MEIIDISNAPLSQQPLEQFIPQQSIQQPSEELIKPKAIEIGKIPFETLFGTAYFEEKGGLLNTIFSAEIDPAAMQQQMVLDQMVLLRLHDIEHDHLEGEQKLISIDVVLNGNKHQLCLKEQRGIAEIALMSDDGKSEIYPFRRLNITFSELKEKLIERIARNLKQLVNEVSQAEHCLDCAQIMKSQNFKHPWFSDFVDIHVEHPVSNQPVSDVGTMVKYHNLFATTAVHIDGNNSSNFKPAEVSAIATAAAISTVECGILLCDLPEENLTDFFLQTMSSLLKKNHVEGMQLFYNGVVLFQKNGEYKKLEFYTSRNNVTVAVSDIVVDIDRQKVKSIELVAMNNKNQKNVLTVSVDVFNYIFQDDFVICSVPTNSPQYKYQRSELEIARSELSTLKSKLTSNISYQSEIELDGQIKRKQFEIAAIEKEMQTPTGQEKERKRILNNKTVDIHVKPLPLFAEDYEGQIHKPEVQFNADLDAIKKLQKLKEALFENKMKLAELMKKEPPVVLDSSEADKLYNKLAESRSLPLSEKLKQSIQLDQPRRKELIEQLKSTERQKLLWKLDLPNQMSVSEQWEYHAKQQEAEQLWKSGKLAASKISEKACELWISEKLAKITCPQTKAEMLQAVVGRKEKEVVAQQKLVKQIISLREGKRQMLSDDARDMQKLLSKPNQDVQQLEKQILHKRAEIEVLDRHQRTLYKELEKPTNYDKSLVQSQVHEKIAQSQKSFELEIKAAREKELEQARKDKNESEQTLNKLNEELRAREKNLSEQSESSDRKSEEKSEMEQTDEEKLQATISEKEKQIAMLDKQIKLLSAKLPNAQKESNEVNSSKKEKREETLEEI